jgi:hypothetical protein
MAYFYEFLAKGIDAEDISYFHKSYETLLSQDALQVPSTIDLLFLNRVLRELCFFYFSYRLRAIGLTIRIGLTMTLRSWIHRHRSASEKKNPGLTSLAQHELRDTINLTARRKLSTSHISLDASLKTRVWPNPMS